GQHTQPVLGEQGRQTDQDIVDRAVGVLVRSIEPVLGDTLLGKRAGDCVDRPIDPRDHALSSRIDSAPDLERLTSTPCPNARATSSSTNSFKLVVASECFLAATRYCSQSAAELAQLLLPSRHTSRT